tara:strand:- start:3577 stop:4191 length:615 start_codon:yes stop_codon:yes gene_type:complete
MEKVTKNARIADLESKLMVMQTQINSLIECGHSHTKRLIALEPDNPFHGKFYEPSEPKPKQLDQSVFDGLDAKWRFAAVVADGRAFVFDTKPDLMSCEWDVCLYKTCRFIDHGYDTSNWQNSLIERDKVELTGSDLCRYIKSRKHWVLAVVSDENDATAEFHQRAIVVTGITSDGRFKCGDMTWRYAVPIDHKGEPLAQSDVGL